MVIFKVAISSAVALYCAFESELLFMLCFYVHFLVAMYEGHSRSQQATKARQAGLQFCCLDRTYFRTMLVHVMMHK